MKISISANKKLSLEETIKLLSKSNKSNSLDVAYDKTRLVYLEKLKNLKNQKMKF